MAKSTDTLQIKSQFDGFEQFAQTIKGCGLDFQQPDRGAFKAKLHQISTPDLLISDAHFNKHLIQRGTQPEGMYTFVIMD